MSTQTAQLAIRPCGENPNHHLWNNHGIWFVHYTIYPDAYRAERKRHSLKTRCLQEARRRRDELFERYGLSTRAAS